jgi:pilus assembly protein CpaB
MNLKTWLPLVLAIVLGLIAAKISHDVIQSRRDVQIASGRMSQIVVAKRTLMPGHVLVAEDLSVGEVAKNCVPESSFANVSDAVGRAVAIQMGKGQPIVDSLLAPRGAGTGLQALVPNGMRAITLEINEFSSVAGMIQPGCRVDVLATIQGKNGITSKTVVQNVKVTAVGARITPPDGNGAEPYKSVTLLATPEQAESIDLASTLGRPRLALRGGRDSDLTHTKGTDVAQLLGESRNTQTVAADPFLVPQPLLPLTFNPPSTAPSTQPAIVQSRPPIDTRSISVIRGGQESFVTIIVPPNSTGVVGADDAPLDSSR